MAGGKEKIYKVNHFILGYSIFFLFDLNIKGALPDHGNTMTYATLDRRFLLCGQASRVSSEDSTKRINLRSHHCSFVTFCE